MDEWHRRKIKRSQQEIKRNMEYYSEITLEWSIAESIYKDLSNAYLSISKIIEKVNLDMDADEEND